MRRIGCLVACLLLCAAFSAAAQPFDLVIANGRVMDPESGLDAVRHVGIRGGKIEALSAAPLQGREAVDARGLVVAPGFINLHWHGTDPRSNYYEAMDGVTSTFELEIGVADVDKWYDERVGRMPINYGVAAGHAPVRMIVMGDPGAFVPVGDAARKAATEEQIVAIAKSASASAWPTRRRRRAGRSCRCSASPRGTARRHSCISAGRRARAVRIVKKGCWR
jgi:hypothetical protein